MNMLLVWLIAVAVFAVLEGVTYQLVCVWFAIGAVGGFLTAYAGLGVNIQMAVFLIISVAALIGLRPISIKLLKKTGVNTNINAFIGKELVVTKQIDNLNASGEGKINGVVWSLRSVNDEIIEKGEVVIVKRVEGVRLYVEKKN